MRATLVNPEAKCFVRTDVLCRDFQGGLRYRIRAGLDFRQHRCDVTNEVVTLLFNIGCERQRFVRGLDDKNGSETGIPHACVRENIPEQSSALPKGFRLAACNDQLCLWCYWFATHNPGSAIPYPVRNVGME
jgi:hypothetical protein